MLKLLMMFFVVVLLISCGTPAPVKVDATLPAETVYLNDNYGLDLGDCPDRMFFTPQWKGETIKQCLPDGYLLHEDVKVHPISIDYTGAAYSIRPHGGYGEIGFMLPVMDLDAGEYVIKVDGDAHFWGIIGDYALRAGYVAGREMIAIGGMPLVANGAYQAMFVLDVDVAGDYQIVVYLLMVHPTMTADSYLTIERITVE